jgi:peptidoglycan/xylan/chitin deacetylase (PgdA/CDA1 family)
MKASPMGARMRASAAARLPSLVLYVVRALGGFALARYLTRRHLRILCYHGFSLGDEHEGAPYTFMRGETFERRLRILRKRRIPVISLDEAIQRFTAGQIAHGETVVTLDDGWASNLSVGVPLLEKYGYPACIYITTEHLDAGTEAFNVSVTYMLLRSDRRTFTLSGVDPRIDGTYDIAANPHAAALKLIVVAEQKFSLIERQRLLRPIAAALGLDIDDVLRDGRLRLADRSEIHQLFSRGMDIQLHTHTHHLSGDSFDAVSSEIAQNRAAIRSITGVEARHFCYPSGLYHRQHPEWLRRLGIASATTCDPGLNAPSDSVMLLKRYLDSDQTDDITFEAQICGVRDLALRILSLTRAFARGGPRLE